MNQIEQMIVPMDWAQRYGFEEAALLWWIVHWIKRSTVNGKGYHDGNTWIYNSRRAWAELFPCWSDKQIYRILDNLIKKGVIQKGEYNNNKYDRTSWYSLRDEQSFGIMLKSDEELGNSTVPNGTMDCPEQDNRLSQTGQPIPVLIHNNNTEDNKKDIPPSVSPSIKTKKVENRDNEKYLPLSKYLLEKIKASGTEAVFNETHLKGWNNHFRLMVTQDGRTEEHIRLKIDAVFADNFWSKVIRSASKLREQWKAGRLDRLVPPAAPKKIQYAGIPDNYYKQD